MKLWNRILAALLAALILCGTLSAVAESEPEYARQAESSREITPSDKIGPTQEETEELVLGLEADSVDIVPDAPLELSDDLALDDLAADDLETVEVEPEYAMPVAALDAADSAGVEGSAACNASDSDFDIRDGVLFKYNGTGGYVVIPKGVTRIGMKAFYECSRLTSVTIPNSVTSIGAEAFKYCDSLTRVTIPNSVTSIGAGAFWDCSSLTSVTIPNSVTSIGMDAFLGCDSLTSVTIPNSVKSIGAWAFAWCSSLTSVTIPNSVTSIGESAFYECSSLTRVTIPNSVTSIGESAFYECSSLTRVTIPNSVTSIGKEAFSECDNLEHVTILSKNPSVDSYPFGEDYEGITFHIVCTSNAVGSYWHAGAKELIIHGNKVAVPAIPASYIREGRKAGTRCSACRKILSGCQAIPKKVLPERGLLVAGTVTKSINLGDKRKIFLNTGTAKSYRSSNSKIVSVSDKGWLNPVKAGTADITITSTDGKKYILTLKVIDRAALSDSKLTISCIDSATIKLTGGLDRNVTWSTSDANVVKIIKSTDSYAIIRAVKNGTATIMAKIHDGKTLKCEVKVVNPLTIVEGDDVYSGLDSWEVGVKFTNNSNKKIIYITFDILQYDNKGDKLKSPYDYYYFNDDLDPHHYDYDIYTVNDDTRSVRFKIREVTFADKTTWKP